MSHFNFTNTYNPPIKKLYSRFKLTVTYVITTTYRYNQNIYSS
jgi:hypothetical protein